MIRLTRLSDQPILAARPQLSWERGAVFNAGVVKDGGKVHLFYRAVNHEPGAKHGQCKTYQSSVGYAVSDDGIHFSRPDEPLIPYEAYGPGCEIQDCRVTRQNGHFVLTYCLYDRKVGHPRPGYSISADLTHWDHKGELVPFADYGFNKNAALFPEKIGERYALFHRPESLAFRGLPERQFDWRTWSRCNDMTEGQLPGITLSYSGDLRHWEDSRVIMRPRPGHWDDNKVGPGAPPLKTPAGWLNVYHGVSKDHVYRLGLALHDLEDPAIVLKRQADCILEPELEWERYGDVDNVVFTCGALMEGTRLTVYYAGADTAIGVAEADVSAWLAI